MQCLVAVLAAGFLLLYGRFALATEDPATPQQAMEWSIEPLVGTWRGTGWMSSPDGAPIEISAVYSVTLFDKGGSARLEMRQEIQTQPHSVTENAAFITYRPPTVYDFGRYYLSYESGRSYELLVPPGNRIDWVEPREGGGTMNWLSTHDDVSWSLVAFCCSGDDAAHQVFFLALRKDEPPP